ncbi:Cache 3/Cache 2 fusion domain-containing protein, partial [Methanocalculus sp.]|uniref:Cache 3/Cache 2 fusion domain-containing protein n=1 Tax=Methanocalculus sp. TaxID=2004547 RepID=UPI002727BE5C
MAEQKKGRLNNMKMGTKILIICLCLVIIPTLLLGIISYNSASAAIEDQIEDQFNLLVKANRDQVDSVYTLTLERVQGDLNVLKGIFLTHGSPQIINDQLVLIDNTGQQYVVNGNYEIVDQVQGMVGGAATVFQVQGNQAIRISTNVIGTDGRRVVGTPVSQEVYNAVVIRGETYYGTANVVGTDYITAYEPIRGPGGAVIGILFVGVREDATLGVVINDMRSTVVGKTGYIYVLDPKGTVIIHPTIEGQSVAQHDFVKQILSQKEGLIRYNWEGADKITAFTYYEPLGWYIVAGADWEDFTDPINGIRNAIVAILIGAIVIGGAIAVLFGRGIARRMGELVALGRRVSDGELSGTISVDQGGDEIGQVAGAFSEVVTTIQQFGTEMTMISAAASEGRLDVRGNAAKFKGDYGKIIYGVNDTLDAVINPLNVAAEYV